MFYNKIVESLCKVKYINVTLVKYICIIKNKLYANIYFDKIYLFGRFKIKFYDFTRYEFLKIF